MKVRQTLIVFVCASLYSLALPPTAYTANKTIANSACKVINQKKSIDKINYVCLRISKKLIWKVAPVIRATPKPSTTPQPVPTPEPDRTPPIILDPLQDQPCSQDGERKANFLGELVCFADQLGKLTWHQSLDNNPKPSPTPTPETTYKPPADINLSEQKEFTEVEACKLRSDQPETENLGFPRGNSFIPALGDRKAIVIFVDYKDLSGSNSQISEWKNHQIPHAETAYSLMSYGKYNLKFEYLEKIYHLNKTEGFYTNGFFPNFSQLFPDAMDAANDDIDFSKYDFVSVVTPATSLPGDGGATGLGGRSYDGKVFTLGIADSVSEYLDDSLKENWLTHETGHLLGLMHGYDYSKTLGAWDVMANSFGMSDDLLGWNKFKLGWITDSQVKCIPSTSKDEFTLLLSPVGTPSNLDKLAVIKLTSTTSLVIESHRKTRFDNVSTSSEGVIVYKIDTSIAQGKGPYSILSNPKKTINLPNRNPLILGTMIPGDSQVIEGYEIKVLKKAADGDYVSIARQ